MLQSILRYTEFQKRNINKSNCRLKCERNKETRSEKLCPNQWPAHMISNKEATSIQVERKITENVSTSNEREKATQQWHIEL